MCLVKKQPCERIAVEIKFTKSQTTTPTYKELFSAYTPNFQKSHFTLSRKKAFEGVQTPSPPIKSIRSNY